MSLVDGARLAVGTFTVLPVAPPRTVDRPTARTAMLLAPLVGLGLGAVGVAVMTAGRFLEGGGHGHLVASAVTVASLALLTRAVHLDGLADTADGLGVRRGRAAALAAMREPGVGAFGAVTLVLALLLQVLALDRTTSEGGSSGALVLALVTSRTVAALACTTGVPAARADGLGAAFAGCLPRPAAAGLLAVPFLLALAWALRDVDVEATQPLLAVTVALIAAAGLLLRCVRRFGGVTGDVLGALVETTVTVLLLVLAASPDPGSPEWAWLPF